MLDSLVRVSRRVGRVADNIATDPRRRYGGSGVRPDHAPRTALREQSRHGGSTGGPGPRALRQTRILLGPAEGLRQQAGYTTRRERLATIPPAF